MNNNFLPDTYEVPESGGNYMKWTLGDNVFRPLASPIVGWEGWKTTPEGKRPVRKRMGEKFPINEVDDTDEVKHFWAFPVYNYQTKSIQILEITQKTIQKAIKSLTRQADWGSPVGEQGYDIVVTKTGEGMDTEYSVMPRPHKPLDPGIMQTFRDMTINVEALFTGDDPFEQKADVDLDEADKAISGE